MRVERLDFVTIFVKDLDKAAKFFSDLFETEFPKSWPTVMDTRETIDRIGINLAAPRTRDGVSSKVMASKGEGLITVGLKVPNLDEAIAELESRGIRFLFREKIAGKVDYAAFHPKDTYGAMFVLTEYKGENIASAVTSK